MSVALDTEDIPLDLTSACLRIFESLLYFLRQLGTMQVNLNTIGSHSRPLPAAAPDYMPCIYQPQLERTLGAAYSLLGETCTALGIVDHADDLSREEETLEGYYRTFLQEVLELFQGMEDVTYKMLTGAGCLETEDPSGTNTSSIDRIQHDISLTIQDVSEQLARAEFACSNPIDHEYYGSRLIHCWPPDIWPEDSINDRLVPCQATPNGGEVR